MSEDIDPPKCHGCSKTMRWDEDPYSTPTHKLFCDPCGYMFEAQVDDLPSVPTRREEAVKRYKKVQRFVYGFYGVGA